MRGCSVSTKTLQDQRIWRLHIFFQRSLCHWNGVVQTRFCMILYYATAMLRPFVDPWAAKTNTILAHLCTSWHIWVCSPSCYLHCVWVYWYFLDAIFLYLIVKILAESKTRGHSIHKKIDLGRKFGFLALRPPSLPTAAPAIPGIAHWTSLQLLVTPRTKPTSDTPHAAPCTGLLWHKHTQTGIDSSARCGGRSLSAQTG